MSRHDEDVLVARNKQLVRALRDVLEIVENVPENLRMQAGLYSMPAFNTAYALLKQNEEQ